MRPSLRSALLFSGNAEEAHLKVFKPPVTLQVFCHASYNIQTWDLNWIENHRKISFNIASKASYVYILGGQKLIKNAKMVYFGEFLKT